MFINVLNISYSLFPSHSPISRINYLVSYFIIFIILSYFPNQEFATPSIGIHLASFMNPAVNVSLTPPSIYKLNDRVISCRR